MDKGKEGGLQLVLGLLDWVGPLTVLFLLVIHGPCNFDSAMRKWKWYNFIHFHSVFPAQLTADTKIFKLSDSALHRCYDRKV